MKFVTPEVLEAKKLELDTLINATDNYKDPNRYDALVACKIPSFCLECGCFDDVTTE